MYICSQSREVHIDGARLVSFGPVIYDMTNGRESEHNVGNIKTCCNDVSMFTVDYKGVFTREFAIGDDGLPDKIDIKHPSALTIIDVRLYNSSVYYCTNGLGVWSLRIYDGKMYQNPAEIFRVDPQRMVYIPEQVDDDSVLHIAHSSVTNVWPTNERVTRTYKFDNLDIVSTPTYIVNNRCCFAIKDNGYDFVDPRVAGTTSVAFTTPAKDGTGCARIVGDHIFIPVKTPTKCGYEVRDMRNPANPCNMSLLYIGNNTLQPIGKLKILLGC